MIIGITGGTGCGKTTALQVFASLGGLVLDCDRIYHELLTTDPALLRAIERRFPGTVTKGKLDRKKLGEQVFSDPEALQALNAITHGAVKAQVEKQLRGEKRHVAIDAIGLFEAGLDRLCHTTVAVTAPEEKRAQRLMDRDGITREYAQKRIDAQPSQEAFTRRCAHKLENNGSCLEFTQKCLAFFQALGIMEERNIP